MCLREVSYLHKFNPFLQASNFILERANALPINENEADMFDISLDNETKRQRTGSSGSKATSNKANFKRQSKNEKYGFGGKKRFSKSGDAMSSAGIGLKGKSGPTKRLGKSRRAKARS
jgi:rRNA-processing protein EBP2